MKTKSLLLMLFVALCVPAWSQVRGDLNGDGIVDVSDVNKLIDIVLGKATSNAVYTVNGVSFEMIPVDGGTFMMGATAEQGDDVWDIEKPVHQVTLSSYSIGKTEVTQELWKAVMGSNPSWYTVEHGYPLVEQRPVECVSWNECQEFITKLNQLTGQTFRLPTEAEWEFAARGGIKSKGYKYAGSNDIDAVAWYENNCYYGVSDLDKGPRTVGTKIPNELGIYDMSGNVYEHTADWYGEYSSEPQTNPTGPEYSTERRFVSRGGDWYSGAGGCRISFRMVKYDPSSADTHIGMRLCGQSVTPAADLDGDGKIDVSDVNAIIDIVLGKSTLTTQSFNVNGVSFKMIAVEGGTFMMGHDNPGANFREEKPAHSVTLSGFSIGETEVTQELWQAVMGSNPSYFTGNLQCPVEQVTWIDCHTFLTKLNALTGKNFRLPTEAEWEFAARGGNKSKGYDYAGSEDIDKVAWYGDNSGSNTRPVATKAPNELGIYDMSGNVCEWCEDWSAPYSAEAQTNPTGSTSGDTRVFRGGSWCSGWRGCWVTHRSNYRPTRNDVILGLRIVL